MCATPAVSPLAARLVTDLSLALLGQGPFVPGRPEVRPAYGILYDGLSRQLREAGQIALLSGQPTEPLGFFSWGIAADRQKLGDLLPVELQSSLLPHLAGSWRDRRLVFISLQHGLARQEFDLFFQLLASVGDKGLELRKRCLEEQSRGKLAHVALLFVDDLRNLDQNTPWPVQAALSWLRRDLNVLSHMDGPIAVRTNQRQGLLTDVLELASGPGEERDLLAHLDQIVEELHDYNSDELAGLLLDSMAQPALSSACTELCSLLEKLQQHVESQSDASAHKRIEPVRWITRRVAERLSEIGGITPSHYHALVLQKVLLYEEIPGDLRARVASLQVLTSFLANPQRYFAEIEGSHSPEVLESRLWRLLEMLPNMLRACRFDVAREVVNFAQRFGPTFDLSRKPQLLSQVRETAAEVLAAGESAQQVELMQTLPLMGHTGLHLLIDLADHSHRSVRRAALDGLAAAGSAVVPVLFESLESKPGWHYLRNMLVILGKVGAGGAKVEAIFRHGLEHPVAAVRKEALPGVARLLRENAAELVAGRLNDLDAEVRRRAVACLGLTGIAAPKVYARLAELLTAKGDHDTTLAVIVTLNRLCPGPVAGPRIEAGLLALVGGGGWFGLGKGVADRALRLEAIKALGQFPGERTRKGLERLLKESDAGVVRVAQEALRAADRPPAS